MANWPASLARFPVAPLIRSSHGNRDLGALLAEYVAVQGVPVNLPFTAQTQTRCNWCWAAVATSVGLFYGTGNWTQCGVRKVNIAVDVAFVRSRIRAAITNFARLYELVYLLGGVAVNAVAMMDHAVCLEAHAADGKLYTEAGWLRGDGGIDWDEPAPFGDDRGAIAERREAPLRQRDSSLNVSQRRESIRL
jgi:hypothetical protein